MDRNTRKILDYISDQEKKAKQMSYVKDLKQEVEIIATVYTSVNVFIKRYKKRICSALWAVAGYNL